MKLSTETTTTENRTTTIVQGRPYFTDPITGLLVAPEPPRGTAALEFMLQLVNKTQEDNFRALHIARKQLETAPEWKIALETEAIAVAQNGSLGLIWETLMRELGRLEE